MTTNEIELFLLSIGDVFELSIKNFFYLKRQEGQKEIIEIEQNKKGEKGWCALPKITGEYCGDNYKNGELNIIKIRVK